mmetsp:Transcript_25862/g.36813  ORF Transcript_25862/g.36813 Transcript_25862/m.36813 type:complete len:91 (+) Transcript_25862:509-781(+)
MSCRAQRVVALFVTEAETIQATECAQDMLYVYWLLTEMSLKVQLPMILECDNKGAIDIANNWLSSGQTWHMDVKVKFLRELKDGNFIRMI